MEKADLSKDYQRIRQIMDSLRFSSDRKFAESIGVSPQNLYDLKSGKTQRISQFIISKILEAYPQFNAGWVMSGEGDMLKVGDSDYQRLESIKKCYGLPNDAALAKEIGVSAQNITDVKRRNRMSKTVATAACKKWEELNPMWVLEGEGDMLKSANIQTIQGDGNHHNTNGQSNDRYIAHLEAEIELLRKEKEDLWALVRKLMKTE